ncbi:hypothetical protein PInf_006007 [Phytophthora infestans]|nr:hypothetical protein PInf_005975 [Phytophthora infestans]KAI9984646.1 hypothetical protein PInf_006007 [Phytophthora infestans]
MPITLKNRDFNEVSVHGEEDETGYSPVNVLAEPPVVGWGYVVSSTTTVGGSADLQIDSGMAAANNHRVMSEARY